MKKYITIFVSCFILLFVVSLIVHIKTNNSKKNDEVDPEVIIEQIVKSVDKDEWKQKLMAVSYYVPITENDKITFAFEARTPTIDKIVESLEKNNYVICHAVGGRMDKTNKGTYFIMTGFNNEGKVKILSPQNNYEEKAYIVERVFENVDKVLLFDE